jgi:hypothetical protein
VAVARHPTNRSTAFTKGRYLCSDVDTGCLKLDGNAALFYFSPQKRRGFR